MEQIFESAFKVSLGGLLLLDYGVALANPGIILNGSHVIQSVHFLRAAGIKLFARGGEQNSIEWTITEPEDGMQAAVKAALDHAVNAPRVVGELVIETEAGDEWRMASAAVESWVSDSTAGEGIIASRTYRVIGGAITATHALDPLENWEGQETLWENA